MISALQKQTCFTLHYFKALLKPSALQLATARQLGVQTYKLEGSLGIWEYGNMGIGEYGNKEIRE